MVVLFPRRIKRYISQASKAKKLFLGLTSLTLSGMPPFLSLLSDVVFRPYTDNHHCYYHDFRIQSLMAHRKQFVIWEADAFPSSQPSLSTKVFPPLLLKYSWRKKSKTLSPLISHKCLHLCCHVHRVKLSWKGLQTLTLQKPIWTAKKKNSPNHKSDWWQIRFYKQVKLSLLLETDICLER